MTASNPAAPRAADLRRIASLLQAEHEIKPPVLSEDPLGELVATILSQHTSDTNSQRAYTALRRRFPRWSEVLAAGVAQVAAAIRSGGLANQKAPRIQAMLRAAPVGPDGEPSLDHLRELGPTAAYEYLQGFDGVGPKTAACTLLFAYGWPVFPVDTHVHRVTKRLGWVGPRDTAEKAQARLMALVPAEATYDLHMGLVRHGRRVCRPTNPDCEGCEIRPWCKVGPQVGGRTAGKRRSRREKG